MRLRCDDFLGELLAQIAFAAVAGLASALAEQAAEAWIESRREPVKAKAKAKRKKGKR